MVYTFLPQSFPTFAVLITRHPGSHIVCVLQETRRYKVVSVDNHHNSHPRALVRVAQLAKDRLPVNATPEEIDSTEIDVHVADITQPDQIRKVFEKYGKGGIWGVIHVAVSRLTSPAEKERAH